MKQAAMAAAAEYTWSNAALQYEAIFKEIGVKDVLNGTSVRWSNKAVKTVIFQQVLVGWGVALINGPHLELHTASFFFEIVQGKYLHFRYKSLRCYYVASESESSAVDHSFRMPWHMLQSHDPIIASTMSSRIIPTWEDDPISSKMFWVAVYTTYLKVEGTSQALIPTSVH